MKNQSFSILYQTCKSVQNKNPGSCKKNACLNIFWANSRCLQFCDPSGRKQAFACNYTVGDGHLRPSETPTPHTGCPWTTLHIEHPLPVQSNLSTSHHKYNPKPEHPTTLTIWHLTSWQAHRIDPQEDNFAYIPRSQDVPIWHKQADAQHQNMDAWGIVAMPSESLPAARQEQSFEALHLTDQFFFCIWIWKHVWVTFSPKTNMWKIKLQ